MLSAPRALFPSLAAPPRSAAPRSRIGVGLVALAAAAALPGPLLAAPAAKAPSVTDDQPGPPLEVASATGQVQLPPLPSFELAAPGPGLRSPRELRLRGKRLLGAEVRVVGYVTYLRDCAAQLMERDRKLTRARALRKARGAAASCRPTAFALGDTAQTPLERSIYAVGPASDALVPTADRERPGGPARRGGIPALELGARVELLGQWTPSAPGDELSLAASPAALLRVRAPRVDEPPIAGAAPADALDDAEPALVPRPAAPPAVSPATRGASLAHQAACTRAFGAGQHAAAVAACEDATRTWAGNHLAWYVLASAHMAQGQWPKARAAMARALELRPDLAMYQLYFGVALYEEALDAARASAAARGAPAPTGVDADTDALRPARQALRRAARQEPALWRAHVYLARIAADLDQPALAATALDAAIRARPNYAFSYASLADLYRRWDHLEAAAAVARLGAEHVPPAEAGALWIVLGAVEEDRGRPADAIAAYDRALTARPELVTALLRRGQLYAKTKDRGRAERDLRAVLASRAAEAAPLVPVATRALEALERAAR